MKKIKSVLLTVIFCMLLTACGSFVIVDQPVEGIEKADESDAGLTDGGNQEQPVSAYAEMTETEFLEAVESSCSSVLIDFGVKFKIFLDDSEQIVAVEFLNDEALRVSGEVKYISLPMSCSEGVIDVVMRAHDMGALDGAQKLAVNTACENGRDGAAAVHERVMEAFVELEQMIGLPGSTSFIYGEGAILAGEN